MEQEKTLTKKQRRFLQFGVVLLLVVFMVGFFFFEFSKNKKEETPKLKNTTVYIQDDKLQVFDDQYTFVPYPDKLTMHYPYLILVKTGIQTTYIYNLEQKKKEKEVKEILLDYTNGNQLITKGNTTYLNNLNLGILCDKGFIKNVNEILCITKLSKDGAPNTLVSINTNAKTLMPKYLYTALIGFLTDVKVINGKIYLGELNTNTQKSRILVDKQPIDVPDIVSVIYIMNGKSHFASFKSALNNNTQSYYLIDGDKIIKQVGNRIYLRK